MVSKKPNVEIDQDIGDITSILNNQGVSDLSWLSISEADYRAAEALPEQNLDMIPEIQDALREGKDGVPSLIPIRPHVMVNTKPVDNSLSVSDPAVPIRNRLAKYIMENRKISEIKQLMSLEFSVNDLRHSSSHISSLLGERGLLGNVYVDPSHFPRCAKDKNEQTFIKKNSKLALYVLSKDECSDCVNNNNGLCSVLDNKRIVSSVPYGTQLASHYAPKLSSESRPIDLSVNGWKERIRLSFLKDPILQNPDGIKTFHTPQKVASPEVTKSDIERFFNKQPEKSVKLSSSYLKFANRMMLGFDDRNMLVASGDSELLKLSQEYGILGHNYLDMDALGGCKSTLEHISKYGGNFVPEFVLRRASCQSCDSGNGDCCFQISKTSTIVDFIPDLGKKSLLKSLLRSVERKTISASQANTVYTKFNGLGTASLRILISSMNLNNPKKTVGEYSGPKAKFYSGLSSDIKKSINPEDIKSSISKLMNEGLSGFELQSSILKEWTLDDLKSVDDISKLSSFEGVQGKYFIDPTAYSDYGSGCKIGSDKLKKSSASLVLASSKCTGCNLQTSSGYCSRYSKTLVRNIPNSFLASVKRKPILPQTRMASQTFSDPASEYELSPPEMKIPGVNRSDFSIEMETGDLGIDI